MNFAATILCYLATIMGATEQSEPQFELSYPGMRFRVSEQLPYSFLTGWLVRLGFV